MNLLVTVGLLLGLAATPANPPSPEEERLFADGLRAFDAGDPGAAATIWKQGYAVGHDPAFLVRIAEAQEKTGATRDAAESYRRYLRDVPDAADRAEIEQRLAHLTVAPGPGPVKAAPDSIPAPGAAPAPGTPPAASAPPAPRAIPAVDNESRPARPRRGEELSGWNGFTTTAWIGVAATALLLGTAAFYGASAASKKDDVNRLVAFRDPDTGAPLEYRSVAAQYQSAVDQGHHDDRVAKVALLAAAGTAAVATTFFVIDGLRESAGSVALAPDDRGAGMSVMGSWRWRF